MNSYKLFVIIFCYLRPHQDLIIGEENLSTVAVFHWPVEFYTPNQTHGT